MYSTISISSGATGLRASAGAAKMPAAATRSEPAPRPDPVAEAQAAARMRERVEAEVRRRMEEETGRMRERYSQCSSRVDVLLERLRRQAAVDVAELALGLAEVVVKHQLPDREMVAGLIRQTLSPLGGAQNVRVRLNPSDALLFQSGEVGGGVPAGVLPPGVEIVRDPALVCGDIVVENGSGVFDGRLETRMSLLAERLRSRVGGCHAESSNP
jgi:flagellar biosynthesis/type III secretory pathway protein FliH